MGVGASLLLSVVLAATCAGLAHALARRHYARLDLSRDRRHSLSEATLDLLGRLTNTVEVVVLLRPGPELDDALDLLANYQAATPRVRVRRLDPDREVAAVNGMARRWPLASVECLVVAAGDRVRVLDPGDLYEEAPSGAGPGSSRVRTAFRGEAAISSAIHEVTRTKAPVVYALTGHGERSPDDTERLRGLAAAARLIRREGIEVRPLVLSEDAGIPADCSVLLIAGPRSRLPQPVLDMVHAHLERNGRAMILLEGGTRTGLESWLRRWGVEVGDDRVVDEGRTLGGGLLITRFLRHGATERMRDLACVFYNPRSVEPAEVTAGPVAGADRPRVVRLALTSDHGWAEAEYSTLPWVFHEGRDRRGPVSVAVAVERGDPEEWAFGIRPARLVVVGDCAFVANGAMVSGNGDFFIGALNWLLERRERVDVPPRRISPTRIDISRVGLRWLGLAVVGGVPGAVALAGLAVWWRRRA